MDKYCAYALEITQQILAIDSPTGYTKAVAEFAKSEYERLGFHPILTNKGNVLVDLGGTKRDNALLTAAHIDTLGAIVAEIKSDGRLRLSPLGGLQPNNTEAENCRIVTRFNGTYEGTFQLINASPHVNTKYSTTERTFDTMEVVLDENVSDKKGVEELGIMVGDIVCFDPRTTVTASGYIKSRFLDDKLSSGILLALAKYISEEHIVPQRRLYQYLTVYEEVGHGACASVPEGTTEFLSVDMGCVGQGLSCTERQVSICAKDSHGPYNYDVITRLVSLARTHGLDYSLDIYPKYGSDVDDALMAGYDVRHGLIGAGVYASHGYERSHIDGLRNTYELLKHYCLDDEMA